MRAEFRGAIKQRAVHWHKPLSSCRQSKIPFRVGCDVRRTSDVPQVTCARCKRQLS